MAASATSTIQQQHEELLAHQHLELRQRDPRRFVRLPKPPQRLKAASSTIPPAEPTSSRAPMPASLKPPEPIFDLAPRSRPGGARSARRPFRAGAKAWNPDQRRPRPAMRASHRLQGTLLADRLLRVAPSIERTDDLLRYPFLERKEGIVLASGLRSSRALSAAFHRRHDGFSLPNTSYCRRSQSSSASAPPSAASLST